MSRFDALVRHTPYIGTAAGLLNAESLRSIPCVTSHAAACVCVSFLPRGLRACPRQPGICLHSMMLANMTNANATYDELSVTHVRLLTMKLGLLSGWPSVPSHEG